MPPPRTSGGLESFARRDIEISGGMQRGRSSAESIGWSLNPRQGRCPGADAAVAHQPLWAVSKSAGGLHPMLNRPRRDLGPRSEIELAKNIADMGRDRPLAHEERTGDLPIRFPLCDQRGYLAFAPGEAAIRLPGGTEGGRRAFQRQRSEGS